MNFNLKEYIKRNLIDGFIDGDWTEPKVAQLAMSYLMQGYLTEEDVKAIDQEVQSVIIAREFEDSEETIIE